MSRRGEITMSNAELTGFLEEERIVTCASIGPNGRPHLMPLWYVMDRGLVTCWTYGKSQKTKNLERRPQATLSVEAGELYQELRGVMMECDVDFVHDLAEKTRIGTRIAIKYAPGATADNPVVQASVAKQAPKRVVLRFRPTHTVSWDHRKLGGGGYAG
jgi:PPOX class probable F420-dependent enzyme